MAEAPGPGPRVVVAGTGHGCRVHVPALRAAGFEVVAVVGTDAERTRRRAAAAGVAAFTDLDTAIGATSATAVVIATPPHTHGALVLAALARGCHVLCEKPFARDAAEARQLLAAAERAGVVHLMGNQFRLQPERRIVADAIAAGLIGTPRFATFVMYAGLAADPESRWPSWWFDRAAGGGWLGASGSHLIDQVRSWLGEFATLSAELSVVAARQTTAEDAYAVRFTMRNGVQGIIQQTGAAWGAPSSMVRVAGSHGTLWTEQGNAWLADRSGTRQLPVPPDQALPAMAASTDPRRQYLHIELPPAQRLCELWRAAIEGRHRAPLPAATFADGLATMQVIDAIRASSARGGALVAVENPP